MPLRGQNNVQGACDMGALAQFYPGYRRVDDPEAKAIFAQAWGVAPDTLSRSPGLTVVEMMHTAAEGQLQAMYANDDFCAPKGVRTPVVESRIRCLSYVWAISLGKSCR